MFQISSQLGRIQHDQFLKPVGDSVAQPSIAVLKQNRHWDGLSASILNLHFAVVHERRPNWNRKASYASVEDQLFLFLAYAERRRIRLAGSIIMARTLAGWKCQVFAGRNLNRIPLDLPAGVEGVVGSR